MHRVFFVQIHVKYQDINAILVNQVRLVLTANLVSIKGLTSLSYIFVFALITSFDIPCDLRQNICIFAICDS